MKITKSEILSPVTFLLLTLGACGAPNDAAEPLEGHTQDDHAAGSHGAMPRASSSGDQRIVTPQLLTEARSAETTARLIAIAPDGREVTLDHGPLEAIGMGAMTMAFNVAPGVDLGGLEAGAQLDIRVRQNRDYTYELTAVCVTDRSPTGDSAPAPSAGNDYFSDDGCLDRTAETGQ